MSPARPEDLTPSDELLADRLDAPPVDELLADRLEIDVDEEA